MKSIKVTNTGGPEVLKLEDITLEKPGADEVQIEHVSIGLNYIELIGTEVNIIPLGNIYFNLGQSYFNLQIFEKAKDSYSKAVTANSKCPSIFNHSLGCSKIYLGD